MDREIEEMALQHGVKTLLSDCINTLENTLGDKVSTQAVTARHDSDNYTVWVRVEKKQISKPSVTQTASGKDGE